jgi:hypothetical protein
VRRSDTPFWPTHTRWSCCALGALAALPLLLTAPPAFGHEDSLPVCETGGQRPEVIAARVEVQRSPEVLSKRINLGDLLMGAGCYDEALHLLEGAEASNPDNRDLRSRLSRARSAVSQIPAQKLSDAAPHRSSFSNAAQASRSN